MVIDGYGANADCRQAVDTFRQRAWVSAPVRDIDGQAVYWRKPGLEEELTAVRPVAVVDAAGAN